MQHTPNPDPFLNLDADPQLAAGARPRAPAGFNEDAYLKAFPDIAHSIRQGDLKSALDHYLRHGVAEDRLADPRYVLALEQAVASDPDRGFPPCGLDAVFAGLEGDCMVVGWIDDREVPLRAIALVARGKSVAATTSIARCRRADADDSLGIPAGHLLGFWTILRLPKGTPVPANLSVELTAGDKTKAVAIEPKLMTGPQLRDSVFEFVAAAAYTGNPQVESQVQLTRGPGAELLRLNEAVCGALADHAHSERFGPHRARFEGSIVVCLYGRPEFLFLQSALYAACANAGAYEFIYVCNSPELTEALQREARIAARIYGLSQTLVYLPGNAGFGAANNVAVQQARSNRLLIVNPDVFPRDPNWTQTHSALIQNAPREQTALFGVPLYYDDGSLMHGGMYFDIDIGISVSPGGVAPQRIVRVEHYGKGAPPDTAAFLRPRAVPAVTGAFISADRAWFEKLGGFSEQYVFGDYEDADLCLKSLAAGRPAWLHNIPFWHFEGKGGTRRLMHDGGSLVNRWHFTRSWGDRIAADLCGADPAWFRRSAVPA